MRRGKGGFILVFNYLHFNILLNPIQVKILFYTVPLGDRGGTL
ncbi:hypothetical protein B4071_4334 [Bacillus subtilis]|nr:hypothetical protein B4071_4334 [Bacillus subtilis]